MSPTLATFLIELVNFLLLAGVLGWVLFKPVRTTLDARRATEAKRADDLAARAAALDRLETEWQIQAAAFEHEMTAARTARLAAAEAEATSIIARAREAAARAQTRSIQALAHVDRAAIEKLAAALAAVSRDAVVHLLATIDAPDLETAFVRAVCHELHQLDGSLGAVVVESAKLLTDRDRDAIAAALAARSTSSVFRVVADLGAGVRVITARGLVEASASGMAADIERRLHARLAAPPQETA